MTIAERPQPEASGEGVGQAGDLVAAAGRAGSVIREQVESIAEAAQSNADEIERRSMQSAELMTSQAIREARDVLDLIRTAERQLSDLRRRASREADILRGALNKAGAPSSQRAQIPGPKVVDERRERESLPAPAEPSALPAAVAEATLEDDSAEEEVDGVAEVETGTDVPSADESAEPQGA